jgi:hypothetical protein
MFLVAAVDALEKQAKILDTGIGNGSTFAEHYLLDVSEAKRKGVTRIEAVTSLCQAY